MPATLDLRRHPQGWRARRWREAALWLLLGAGLAGLALQALLLALPDAAHWQSRLQAHEAERQHRQALQAQGRAAQARLATEALHEQQWQAWQQRQAWLERLGAALVRPAGWQLQQVQIDAEQAELQLWAPQEATLQQVLALLQASGTGAWQVQQQSAQPLGRGLHPASAPALSSAPSSGPSSAPGWLFVLQGRLAQAPAVPAVVVQKP